MFAEDQRFKIIVTNQAADRLDEIYKEGKGAPLALLLKKGFFNDEELKANFFIEPLSEMRVPLAAAIALYRGQRPIQIPIPGASFNAMGAPKATLLDSAIQFFMAISNDIEEVVRERTSQFGESPRSAEAVRQVVLKADGRCYQGINQPHATARLLSYVRYELSDSSVNGENLLQAIRAYPWAQGELMIPVFEPVQFVGHILGLMDLQAEKENITAIVEKWSALLGEQAIREQHNNRLYRRSIGSYIPGVILNGPHGAVPLQHPGAMYGGCQPYMAAPHQFHGGHPYPWQPQHACQDQDDFKA